MQKIWERYHGISILLYYGIGFTGLVVWPHPVLLLCAFAVLFTMEIMETGVKRAVSMLGLNLSLGALIIVFNLLVNHRGPTTLLEWNSWRFTKESLFFGMQLALIFLCCMRLFLQFSRRMTDEKILSLMAGRMPGLAMLFSMILRLVPEVRRDAANLRMLHGRSTGVWRALITMTLEDGVIRSISMRDRGYESGTKRSSLYRRKMHFRDGLLLTGALLWLGGLLWIGLSGGISARFFPTIAIAPLSWYIVVLWCLFYSLPLILWGREVIACRISKQRIFDTPMRRESALR